MLYNEALNIHIEYLNSTFYPPSSFLRAALKFSLLQFLFINYSIRFETLEFPKKKKNASHRATSFFPILLTSFLKQDFQEFSPSTFETKKKKKTKEKDNTKIKISSISSLENVLHFTKRKISPVEKRTIEKKRGKKKKRKCRIV